MTAYKVSNNLVQHQEDSHETEAIIAGLIFTQSLHSQQDDEYPLISSVYWMVSHDCLCYYAPLSSIWLTFSGKLCSRTYPGVYEAGPTSATLDEQIQQCHTCQLSLPPHPLTGKPLASAQ